MGGASYREMLPVFIALPVALQAGCSGCRRRARRQPIRARARNARRPGPRLRRCDRSAHAGIRPVGRARRDPRSGTRCRGDPVAGKRGSAARGAYGQSTHRPSSGGRLNYLGSRPYATAILKMVNFRIDLFLLAAFVANAEVGYYAVAVALTLPLPVVAGSLGWVLFPRVASLAEDAESASGIESKTVRHVVVLIVAGWAALAAMLIWLVVPVFEHATRRSPSRAHSAAGRRRPRALPRAVGRARRAQQNQGRAQRHARNDPGDGRTLSAADPDLRDRRSGARLDDLHTAWLPCCSASRSPHRRAVPRRAARSGSR